MAAKSYLTDTAFEKRNFGVHTQFESLLSLPLERGSTYTNIFMGINDIIPLTLRNVKLISNNYRNNESLAI